MKWSIGTKIGAGFALALVALVVLGTLSYRSTTGLAQSNDWVTHTYQVIGDLEAVLSDLKDAETGQRGYIIAGEDSYLQPYDQAISQVDQRLKEARDLTSDNPRQQKRLDALQLLVASKFAELKATIDLRRNQGFDAAVKVVKTNQGKNTMDGIRKIVGEMEGEENALLKQRTDTARSDARFAGLTTLYGTLLCFIILAGAGFLITRNITAPLGKVTQTARKIQSGDLAIDLMPASRKDEVGMLTESFNQMAAWLQGMARLADRIASGDLSVQVAPQSEKDILGKAFQQMVENLRRVNREIQEGMNILGSGVTEILAMTTQVAAGAAETATAVSETTTTVEEVKQTAQMATQKAKYVSESAQKSAQVSQAGKKSLQETVEGMERIQGQMGSIGESIVRLSEQSQAIGEIIATVNDLAEQSNLLAVNAAIEAAKAGEQGKGFAVVAQEVKNLAEQSKQATAQVRGILMDIQKATSGAVMATEQGSKAVESGVQQSREAGESMRLLTESIAEAAQAATQIAASSQQQLVGMDQVALAMENIKQASTQNVASTKQAETAAQTLHETGRKLKSLVEQYKM